MSLDPLEKEQLRRKMATRMSVFLEGGKLAQCVSAHFHPDAPHGCELCLKAHAVEYFVIKNRGGKKFGASLDCLKEMIRFQVVDVEELSKWILKLPELRQEYAKKQEENRLHREEERKKLERKVMVRKKEGKSSL